MPSHINTNKSGGRDDISSREQTGRVRIVTKRASCGITSRWDSRQETRCVDIKVYEQMKRWGRVHPDNKAGRKLQEKTCTKNVKDAGIGREGRCARAHSDKRGSEKNK